MGAKTKEGRKDWVYLEGGVRCLSLVFEGEVVDVSNVNDELLTETFLVSSGTKNE